MSLVVFNISIQLGQILSPIGAFIITIKMLPNSHSTTDNFQYMLPIYSRVQARKKIGKISSELRANRPMCLEVIRKTIENMRFNINISNCQGTL